MEHSQYVRVAYVANGGSEDGPTSLPYHARRRARILRHNEETGDKLRKAVLSIFRAARQLPLGIQ